MMTLQTLKTLSKENIFLLHALLTRINSASDTEIAGHYAEIANHNAAIAAIQQRSQKFVEMLDYTSSIIGDFDLSPQEVDGITRDLMDHLANAVDANPESAPEAGEAASETTHQDEDDLDDATNEHIQEIATAFSRRPSQDNRALPSPPAPYDETPRPPAAAREPVRERALESPPPRFSRGGTPAFSRAGAIAPAAPAREPAPYADDSSFQNDDGEEEISANLLQSYVDHDRPNA